MTFEEKLKKEQPEAYKQLIKSAKMIVTLIDSDLQFKEDYPELKDKKATFDPFHGGMNYSEGKHISDNKLKKYVSIEDIQQHTRSVKRIKEAIEKVLKKDIFEKEMKEELLKELKIK